MPPRQNLRQSGTTSAQSVPRSIASKKRKNTERSDDDDDDDSDFVTQKYQPALAKSKQSQHRKNLPRQSSHGSEQRIDKAIKQGEKSLDADGLGHNKQVSSGTVEKKRAKRSVVIEEDRGFVFARKTTTTSIKALATTTSTTTQGSKTTASITRNGTVSQEFDTRRSSSPPLPPSPERTPSRDMVYTNRAGTKANPAKQTRGNHYPDNGLSSDSIRQMPPFTPQRASDSVIAIPMRETPTIKKNKDLRSGSRRSSFALRGKRASSIGNGFSALPHPAVDSRYFYRHISADDPPPLRMKQLMAWCARKTIDNFPEPKGAAREESTNAMKIARLIEEETLALLVSGKFSVSWYSRPSDLSTIGITNKPKKPHAQNVSNQKKLQEYEAQIAKLRKEDEEWTRVISSYNNFHAALLDSGPELPPGDEPITVSETFLDNIELDLLTADERSLWDKHIKEHPSSTIAGSSSSSLRRNAAKDSQQVKPKDDKWLTDIMGSLEKEVDSLRDTLYVASRFDKVARQYTDQVLEQIASALAERQRPRVIEPSIQPSSVMQLEGSLSNPSSSSAQLKPSEKSLLDNSTKPSPPQPPSTPGTALRGPDSADDPRQILRALSRLRL
ncbi:hypothetical protein BGZ94_001795 [Podila epigama]|nr:hypothetical protein BGZ94_001795 [Podila epigama]